MPKPNLSGMNVAALLSLRDQVDKRLVELRSELEKLLATMGGAKSSKAKSLKGKKVAPKYRSPDGETWAGRGAKPRWLVAALKKGKKIESFLIKGRQLYERRHATQDYSIACLASVRDGLTSPTEQGAV